MDAAATIDETRSTMTEALETLMDADMSTMATLTQHHATIT